MTYWNIWNITSKEQVTSKITYITSESKAYLRLPVLTKTKANIPSGIKQLLELRILYRMKQKCYIS